MGHSAREKTLTVDTAVQSAALGSGDVWFQCIGCCRFRRREQLYKYYIAYHLIEDELQERQESREQMKAKSR
jgi:hypothetical protein